ncbi:alginate export family protein [Polaribacter uvawellassae]|uniref:alginate export family protein n=1 Tax=Polaribacter uvawellassae TaxID=3133495 RepID=UPI0032199784
MRKLIFSLLMITIFALPLSAQQVHLSGELRPRYENKHGYQSLLKLGEEGSSFISQRTRLNLNYQQDNFKVRISLQNVRVWGDVGTLSAQDKSSSFHEAWTEFSVANYFDLKLGRQEIIYDDSRIFGNVGWAQQGRSHDAIIAKFKTSDNGKLDIGFALNNDSQAGVKTIYSNVAGYKTFQYVWYNTKINNFGISILALNNGIEHLDVNNEADVSYSQTFGPRITYKKKSLSIDAAAYLQSGKVKTTPISASYYSANINVKTTKEFNLGLGFEYLSGKDTNDSSTDLKSFNPIFGTNHKFNGWMDYFYVGNHINSVGLIDIHATVSYTKDKFSAKLVPHIFKSAADIYNGTTKMNSSLGTEIDFTLGYKIADNIQFSAGYSQMFGTTSLEALKGGLSNKNNSWTWFMLTFKPTFYASN